MAAVAPTAKAPATHLYVSTLVSNRGHTRVFSEQIWTPYGQQQGQKSMLIGADAGRFAASVDEYGNDASLPGRTMRPVCGSEKEPGGCKSGSDATVHFPDDFIGQMQVSLGCQTNNNNKNRPKSTDLQLINDYRCLWASRYRRSRYETR